VTPEAERRLAKAARFLAQAARLSADEVPEAIIHFLFILNSDSADCHGFAE